FSEALHGVGGRAVRLPSRPAALEEVRRLVGDGPAVVDRHDDLAGLGAILPLTDDPWAADAGVTGAVAAVADTGSLALVCDAGRPRSTSLVPPRHIALVPVTRLVPRYPDAVELLAAQRPLPSAMYFVTGPSRSGDIELTLVRGMHGPGQVDVVLYDT
ncbi:MAG: LutC/YkgG family protein, partial [Carbonactinosporaceae bacterium]